MLSEFQRFIVLTRQKRRSANPWYGAEEDVRIIKACPQESVYKGGEMVSIEEIPDTQTHEEKFKKVVSKITPNEFPDRIYELYTKGYTKPSLIKTLTNKFSQRRGPRGGLVAEKESTRCKISDANIQSWPVDLLSKSVWRFGLVIFDLQLDLKDLSDAVQFKAINSIDLKTLDQLTLVNLNPKKLLMDALSKFTGIKELIIHFSTPPPSQFVCSPTLTNLEALQLDCVDSRTRLNRITLNMAALRNLRALNLGPFKLDLLDKFYPKPIGFFIDELVLTRPPPSNMLEFHFPNIQYLRLEIDLGPSPPMSSSVTFTSKNSASTKSKASHSVPTTGSVTTVSLISRSIISKVWTNGFGFGCPTPFLFFAISRLKLPNLQVFECNAELPREFWSMLKLYAPDVLIK